MSREDKKPAQKPVPPSESPAAAVDDDTERLDDLDQDLTERHIPLDGSPPGHWKHVDTPLTEDERMKIEAAREEHQERAARGRPLGKL